jgi:hypothetical protein
MSVYIYGLTFQDIVDELPGISSENISPTTQPLSTGDLTKYIEDGAGKLNAAVAARGVQPSATMDANDHAALKECVKNYAVAKGLKVIGISGALYEAAWDSWSTQYTEYSNRPQQLAGFTDTTTVLGDTLTMENGFVSSSRGGVECWTYVGLCSKNMW